MLRTILFFSIFWIILTLSIVFILIFYTLRLLRAQGILRRYIYFMTSNWAKFTIFTAGIKLKVTGKENIPLKNKDFVIVSNHQGNFDIPIYLACLPFSAGFIAKKELMKVPFIRTWMKSIDCQPIDRDNPRESRERLIERIQGKDLNPIFLFPEGTRSRSGRMGLFRTGTLKLIFMNRINVLPVTIDGSYKCFEELGKITGGTVNVTFHPVMKVSEYNRSEFERFNMNLQNIISSNLSGEFEKQLPTEV